MRGRYDSQVTMLAFIDLETRVPTDHPLRVIKMLADLRRRGVTPHVAQNNKGRSSAIDSRTTRHTGYAVSQRIRKRVEEIFGWMKTVGGFRRTRYRGLDRTGLAGNLVATAYNLVRMAKLLGQAAATPEARMA